MNFELNFGTVCNNRTEPVETLAEHALSIVLPSTSYFSSIEHKLEFLKLHKQTTGVDDLVGTMGELERGSEMEVEDDVEEFEGYD